jgi:hypothetical protein
MPTTNFDKLDVDELDVAGVDITQMVAEVAAINGLTATATELNQMCDLSTKIQVVTAAGAGAITAGKEAVIINNTGNATTLTMATAVAHQGLFLIKAGSEPGAGQDHTATITTGSWNGTNKIATFADAADALLVYFDAAGAGTILVNIGAVALSG